MRKYFTSYLLLFCFLGGVYSYGKTLTVNELFNNGVVLQQKSKTLVWGKSEPGSNVTVLIQGKSFVAKTNEKGDWKNELNSLQPGGPFKMTIKSGNESLVIREVYVGEVWIAGGQSNMVFRLKNDEKGKEEIANAKNTNIRFVMVPVITYPGEKTDGDLNWRTATTENVASMSAIAYYFAKELQQKLNVPIGIICCYKGATSAEVWMSRETLLSHPDHAPIVKAYDDYMNKLGQDKYEILYAQYQKAVRAYRESLKADFKKVVRPTEPMGPKNFKRPCGLYETMFKRIIPYTSRGVIWYQGSANATRAEQYRTLFPALINEWRADLQNNNLPFLFVQLASYDNPAFKGQPFLAELREAQLLTWQKVKDTGMAVTIDVGEKNIAHFPHKEPVGKRLAAIAFNQVYGLNVPYSGPIFKEVTFNGNKAVLSFNFIYGGLTSERELKGFTICGTDRKFVPAKAEIIGERIEVSSPEVPHPVAVRYGWANWTDANLRNIEGFPASPFRTDDFPLLTAGVRVDSALYKIPKYYIKYLNASN
jgi:sialate O-acetylesterase